MAKNKAKKTWVCSNCNATYIKETFKCSKCGSYDIEEKVESNGPVAGLKIDTTPNAQHVITSKAYTVNELNATESPRVKTGVAELDRVLDGGLVDDQVVLIGAEPGFGKSTLCIEVLASMANRGIPALYASGEESAQQIANRAKRLGIRSDNLSIVSTTSVEDVIAHADAMHAGIICVDSLQAMASASIDSGLGSLGQSKEAVFAFRAYAKDHGIPMLVISQFTKNDEVAGSNQIPHAVDTILVGESDDETPLKFLRSRKNRYGRTGITGVFIHEEDGIKSVSDPSAYLMGGMDTTLAGAAKTIINDGGRLLPVEVDVLCAPAAYGLPQRQCNGIQPNRGKLLVARLTVSVSTLGLDGLDVFISTMNNVRVSDPNADLAVIAAIVSSSLGHKPRGNTMWVGEVALTGQVRGRGSIIERTEEAIRLGFDRVVCSTMAEESLPAELKDKIEVIPVSMVQDVLHAI